MAQGNLGADPEMRQVGDQRVWAFPIYVKTGSRKDDILMKCNAWENVGEMISKYFTSGKPITVYGELELNELERGETKYKDFQLNVRGWNFVNFGQPQQQKEDSNGPF